jgi:hypothetical protein
VKAAVTILGAASFSLSVIIIQVISAVAMASPPVTPSCEVRRAELEEAIAVHDTILMPIYKRLAPIYYGLARTVAQDDRVKNELLAWKDQPKLVQTWTSSDWEANQRIERVIDQVLIEKSSGKQTQSFTSLFPADLCVPGTLQVKYPDPKDRNSGLSASCKLKGGKSYGKFSPELNFNVASVYGFGLHLSISAPYRGEHYPEYLDQTYYTEVVLNLNKRFYVNLDQNLPVKMPKELSTNQGFEAGRLSQNGGGSFNDIDSPSDRFFAAIMMGEECTRSK